MMTKMTRVRYGFTTPAKLLGEMEVPKAMFDALPDDEAWSDEIEKYILDRHDYLLQPPEIEPEFDADFDDVAPVKDAKAEGQS